MSDNDNQKLVDTVMGEAVMALLESEKAVSFDELIAKLQESLSNETDPQRQAAYRAAIGGIHKFRSQPVVTKHSRHGVEYDLLLKNMMSQPGTTKH
ncbi:biofilm development regulator YmgB/AriR family protein [Atlantibacter sp.]|uniref:biofilm development regulator YmgB/AriR family protein n=1 Tax=Atlantibacter sp. TaxID=1903473 RepID=UPI0028AB93A6|nr:biofilm development regulator YmgB/AriR family protein [Atlantibacter sp.]